MTHDPNTISISHPNPKAAGNWWTTWVSKNPYMTGDTWGVIARTHHPKSRQYVITKGLTQFEAEELSTKLNDGGRFHFVRIVEGVYRLDAGDN